MKELSIKEKAKRYDEAKINGSRLWECGEITRENYEYMFPEIKESEDEMIREELLNAFQESEDSLYMVLSPQRRKSFIAWLEKQGKNNMSISEATKQELEDNLNKALEKETPESCNEFLEKQGEHKSVDKVEPKFKVGDWVVHNMSDGRKAIRQIVKMTNKSYVLDGGGFDTFYFNDLENDYHLWTIQDAKDGDVLATSAGAFIYNGNNGGGSCPGSYCGIDNLGKFKTGVEHHWTGKKVYPATKEQRDTLMETMADDGYTFDFEKKELKKIEQNSIEPDDIIEESYQQQANDVIDMVTEKPANIIQEDFEKYVEHLLSLSDGEGHGSPAKVKEVCYELLRLANLQQKPWSEEDEKISLEIKCLIGNYRTGDNEYRLDLWIDNLKERVQPKQEWSEEDEEILNLIIARLHSHPNVEAEEYDKDYHWLKFLKDRYTWKPSEEQMEALLYEVNAWDEDSVNGQNLKSLYEQLKKLREE